jgi:signal transduction histidine kinase
VAKIPFTVDAALLRELGERLVGRPHIALAELVKNSYDADATRVQIRITSEVIEVADNGHGMDMAEFKRFWMRIGTPHKQAERVSRELHRGLTGSKGVGRLAVQFLGHKVRLTTVAKKPGSNQLDARVDWTTAVKKRELTEAVATCTVSSPVSTFPGDSAHGTRVQISRLSHHFEPKDLERLGQELWMLQPPFRGDPEMAADEKQGFRVELETVPAQDATVFESQMLAWLDNWHATIVGKLVRPPKRLGRDSGAVELTVQFHGGRSFNYRFDVEECMLHDVEFEIRVFHLMYRQRHGIELKEMREYLREHGGVHVYDAGFHLPYYGLETDWLELQLDHSRRISVSQLLPKKLQVPEGMNFLPTNSRVFGVVRVNTAAEREVAAVSGREMDARSLTVQVSRDRLVDNEAFDHLRRIIRTAVDYYAIKEALRKRESDKFMAVVEPMSRRVARVADVLERYEAVIPKAAFVELKSEIRDAVEAAQKESHELTARSGLLGALATAGISALAFEHEINRRYGELEMIAQELVAISESKPGLGTTLGRIANRLRGWIEDARATRSIFLSLTQEENRTRTERYRAHALLEQVKHHIQPILRDSEVLLGGVDPELRLPSATFAEWSAVFQNVFVNAVNAMIDSRRRTIAVSSRERGTERVILVQDTGAGVNLAAAEDLFEPFVRRLKISKERQSLGLGGTGLGLSIVRMIAEGRNCRVGFVKPDSGFKTAFRLVWSEKE